MALDNRPNSFFDKNTLIAIALSFAVFALWQTYMSKKYPAQPKAPALQSATQTTGAATAVPGNTDPKTNPGANPPAVAAGNSAAVPAPAQEQILKFESKQISFELSSFGMGLKSLALPEYLDRRNEPIQYNPGDVPLISTVVNGLRNYSLTKVSETEFRGVATDNNLTVTKTITVDPSKYLLHVKVETRAKDKQKILMNNFVNGKVESVSKNFLLPSYEHQEFFVKTNEKDERVVLSPEDPLKNIYGNVQLASFNSHYFSLLLANRTEALFPSVTTEVTQGSGSVDLKYETAQPVDSQDFNYDFYVGPKDMDLLKSIDPDFKEVIDYGFFSFIGRPMLWLLKFLQSLVHNWGVAIILLTLILRIVLVPVNLYSFKAMQKMQVIQPQLKALKEKYKNDPQRVNQETLLIMKREKANPLSGCIPALMQIPIFFALYSVLGKSIELYRQPFFLWVNDLSLKDPFFIFPILVGLTFFVQQKVTPATTMDPTQQKVLMFMPLIFSLFMLSTPSGLTLYMFVNGLFGLVQQIIFTKGNGSVPRAPHTA